MRFRLSRRHRVDAFDPEGLGGRWNYLQPEAEHQSGDTASTSSFSRIVKKLILLLIPRKRGENYEQKTSLEERVELALALLAAKRVQEKHQLFLQELLSQVRERNWEQINKKLFTKYREKMVERTGRVDREKLREMVQQTLERIQNGLDEIDFFSNQSQSSSPLRSRKKHRKKQQQQEVTDAKQLAEENQVDPGFGTFGFDLNKMYGEQVKDENGLKDKKEAESIENDENKESESKVKVQEKEEEGELVPEAPRITFEDDEDVEYHFEEFLRHDEIDAYWKGAWEGVRSMYESKVIVPLEDEFMSEHWKQEAWRARKTYTEMMARVHLSPQAVAYLKESVGILEMYKYLNDLYKKQLVDHADAQAKEEAKLKTKISRLEEELQALQKTTV